MRNGKSRWKPSRLNATKSSPDVSTPSLADGIIACKYWLYKNVLPTYPSIFALYP